MIDQFLLLSVWFIATLFGTLFLLYKNASRAEQMIHRFRIEYTQGIPWHLINPYSHRYVSIHPHHVDTMSRPVSDRFRYVYLTWSHIIVRMIFYTIICSVMVLFHTPFAFVLGIIGSETIIILNKTLSTGKHSYYKKCMFTELALFRDDLRHMKKRLQGVGYYFFSNNSYKFVNSDLASPVFDSELRMVYTAFAEYMTREARKSHEHNSDRSGDHIWSFVDDSGHPVNLPSDYHRKS